MRIWYDFWETLDFQSVSSVNGLRSSDSRYLELLHFLRAIRGSRSNSSVQTMPLEACVGMRGGNGVAELCAVHALFILAPKNGLFFRRG
jgi:hypothetical protein